MSGRTIRGVMVMLLGAPAAAARRLRGAALPLAGALLAVGLGIWAMTGLVRGATGDNLDSFDAAVTAGIPSCGVGTGNAFDGTYIYLSCWGSNVLERVDASTHLSGGPITISGVTDLGAMAWDASRGRIWACQGGSQVYLIDTAAMTGALQFSTSGCVDGLAYDGTDDTIWASCDVCGTIYHYSTTGTLIDSFSLSGLLGGFGNSGIAVGGDFLFLANNGGSQIYQCPKDLSSCTLISTFEERLEDLECDDITFAPLGAIWSQDAYDRIQNAWEVPAGLCGFGGEPPGGGATATPTTTATAPPEEEPRVGVRSFPTTPTPVPPSAATPSPPPPLPAATATAIGGIAPAILPPSTGSGGYLSEGGSTAPLAPMLVASLGALAAGSALLALRRRATGRRGS